MVGMHISSALIGSLSQRWMLVLFALMVSTFYADPALATVPAGGGSTSGGTGLGSIFSIGGLAPFNDPGETIGRVLCRIAMWFEGPIGQALATLAVATLGVMAMLGRVTHGQAILTIAGVATIFSAPELLNDFASGGFGGSLFSASLGVSGGLVDTGCYELLTLTVGIPVGGSSAIGDVLCEVVEWIMGPIGRGVGTLAIIVLGVGALFGKVSWGMALTTMVGIAVIFSAPRIVTELVFFANAAISTGCTNLLTVTF